MVEKKVLNFALNPIVKLFIISKNSENRYNAIAGFISALVVGRSTTPPVRVSKLKNGAAKNWKRACLP